MKVTLSSTTFTIEGEAVYMMKDIRDAKKVLPSILSHQSQKFLGEEKRLGKRVLETDSPGLKFLPFYIIADGKVGREKFGDNRGEVLRTGWGHHLCIGES